MRRLGLLGFGLGAALALGHDAPPAVEVLLRVAAARPPLEHWRGRLDALDGSGLQGGVALAGPGSWRVGVRDALGRPWLALEAEAGALRVRGPRGGEERRFELVDLGGGWGPSLLGRVVGGGLPQAPLLGPPVRVGREVLVASGSSERGVVRVGLDARDGWPVWVRVEGAPGMDPLRVSLERDVRGALPARLRVALGGELRRFVLRPQVPSPGSLAHR